MDNTRKLFIGELSWNTTTASLRSYFTQFGNLTDCIVMRNRDSGQSRGFGFVTFSDDAAAEIVYKKQPHKLDGRTIDIKPSVRLATPKSRVRVDVPRVFVGGIPSEITESQLRSIFEVYGKVVDILIVIKDDQRMSGFAFVSFETWDVAYQLIKKRFIKVNEKQVEIKQAEPRPADQELLQPFYVKPTPTTCEYELGDDLITF